MSVATFHVGDVFDVMAGIPDASIDLVVTSPPFLALRSYLPAGHPDKAKEIGSEATPAAFLSTLLALTREWRRILAPHGSICVELGDTYSGGSAEGTDQKGSTRYPNGRGMANLGDYTSKKGAGWPLDKSLCLLPTLYPASLAYGWNMLDPDDRIDPWRMRNLIVWHRPNPPVGALGDKVRPSTSYVTVACMRRDRWFDLDAERTEHASDPAARRKQEARDVSRAVRPAGTGGAGKSLGAPSDGGFSNEGNPAGAPPPDHWQLDEDDPTEHQSWTIPTQPYAGAHYATFPIALPRRLIRLMCPMHVCRTCGQPRRRIVDLAPGVGGLHHGNGGGSRTIGGHPNGHRSQMGERQATTLGWSDCGHDPGDGSNYRRGRVLDPFAGSGTTLAAATEQGRDAIGIDLDSRNLDLARERIGLFLEEVA